MAGGRCWTLGAPTRPRSADATAHAPCPHPHQLNGDRNDTYLGPDDEGDYGRACSVEDLIGIIEVGPAQALVLGNDPAATTFPGAQRQADSRRPGRGGVHSSAGTCCRAARACRSLSLTACAPLTSPPSGRKGDARRQRRGMPVSGGLCAAGTSSERWHRDVRDHDGAEAEGSRLPRGGLSRRRVGYDGMRQ
ncbi:Imm21 family immunity protein [Streptomyces sp. NPDC002838]|uniref:Imm21 family immunity protein n=1 Tax=Streptomyces sp. NPDC002838 TaxID=3154436 RepID=UPI0033335EFD